MKLLSPTKLIVVLITLIVIDCGLGGFIGVWREWYWQSLVDKKFSLWLWYVAQFTGVALLSCLITGFSNYLGNILGLHYRTTLTRKALQLDNHHQIEGGAQRVQEDCLNYPQLLIQLIMGLLRSFVMVFVFVAIIVHQLPVQYFIIPIVYTLIGTFLASKIARPLINLNYINQVLEAKFRQVLSKLNYSQVHDNNVKMFRRLKYLQYFQSFYQQITVIIPHIMLLFVYFSAKITFGVFMQIASSMAELINNLSYFITSFDVINRWLSCRRRLKELNII